VNSDQGPDLLLEMLEMRRDWGRTYNEAPSFPGAPSAPSPDHTRQPKERQPTPLAAARPP
jgi:hypothetical protein